MDVQKIFDILGIGETKDEEQIRAAYRDRLAFVNPEDNPEGFKRLREAYEGAVAFARRQEETAAEEEDPVSLFLKEAEQVYRSLSRRLNTEEWERLARRDVLDDLDLGEDAKWGLFAKLAQHYRMPSEIWRVLDRAFKIAENESEFKEHLNKNFVDYMLWKISDEAGGSDFPYAKFAGEDTADYDAFMDHFDNLSNLTRNNRPEDEAAWKKEMEQEAAFLESLGISHPWLVLERAKVDLIMEKKEAAEAAVRALWETEKEDLHVLLAGADILGRCGYEDEAAAAYEELLEKENLSDERIYTASVKLAEYCLKREKMLEAREHALRACRTYNTQTAVDLLDRVNGQLIELYTKERADELTEEEGIRLAWCLIQSGKSSEGWEFFAEHPLLEADTAECHWAKTIMALESDLPGEAAGQARQWRACILKESAAEREGSHGGEDAEAAEGGGILSDEAGLRLAQSFKMEGRALQLLYNGLEDKGSEEARQLYEAATAAFDEAISREPEELDFLMSKMLFLRDVQDFEQMARLCERMKELDNQFFWAYFYGQEAYEKLGRAQEVVNAFYDAKRIYAGKAEIYERAVRVFLAYGQYKDGMHIIEQAEEAGVDSFFLMLKKLEILRRLAADEASLKEADRWAEQVIREFEEKNAPAEQLAEACLQRCFVQDDSRAQHFRSVDGMEQWARRAVGLEDNDRNRYFLGRFYLVYRNDAKRAYENLKICEQRGLDFSWMYFYLARCHEKFEQWEEALKYFKLAAQKDPEEPDFKWRAAWRLRWKFNQVNQPEYGIEALQYLEEQKEKFGATPRDLWQASDLHGSFEEYGKALEEIEQALEVSQLSRNWGQKGLLLDRLGRRREAFACYERAIEIDLEQGKDYGYGYTKIYNFFCETRDFEGGIAWFSKTLGQLKTEEQRRKNLDRIKNFYLLLERYEEALDVLAQLYDRTGLKDYAGSSWEREGARIEDLLDVYGHFLSKEELERKAQEALALLEGEGAARLEESFEGKRRAYMELGFCWMNYLLDDEKGLECFQKALRQQELAGEEADRLEYCTTLKSIMKALWHLGRKEETQHYRELYWKSQEKEYEDCRDLGKSVEELYERACGCERTHLYDLFILSFYSGDLEQARGYAERMGCSKWCEWCTRSDCSELWECKGLLALRDGDREEAVRLFRRAVAGAVMGNPDAARELRRLGEEF